MRLEVDADFHNWSDELKRAVQKCEDKCRPDNKVLELGTWKISTDSLLERFDAGARTTYKFLRTLEEPAELCTWAELGPVLTKWHTHHQKSNSKIPGVGKLAIWRLRRSRRPSRSSLRSNRALNGPQNPWDRAARSEEPLKVRPKVKASRFGPRLVNRHYKYFRGIGGLGENSNPPRSIRTVSLTDIFPMRGHQSTWALSRLQPKEEFQLRWETTKTKSKIKWHFYLRNPGFKEFNQKGNSKCFAQCEMASTTRFNYWYDLYHDPLPDVSASTPSITTTPTLWTQPHWRNRSSIHSPILLAHCQAAQSQSTSRQCHWTSMILTLKVKNACFKRSRRSDAIRCTPIKRSNVMVNFVCSSTAGKLSEINKI